MTKSNLSDFLVLVTIENKPYVSDPEGETILRDLVVKGGYSNIKSVRSTKNLKMIITAKSKSVAEESVRKMCKELRIFNPVISNCSVKAMLGEGR
ncbi:MAG: phosphoribosylformylglycinamidine synthase subunit PurS [Nitrosopumilales archaeon]|jgi:phosphoribosylformylglycinamidine synthase|nr:phosphoribosylformylglycinamidine synthase subunit PurS [Nitrosopumilales archaeon]